MKPNTAGTGAPRPRKGQLDVEGMRVLVRARLAANERERADRVHRLASIILAVGFAACVLGILNALAGYVGGR